MRPGSPGGGAPGGPPYGPGGLAGPGPAGIIRMQWAQLSCSGLIRSTSLATVVDVDEGSLSVCADVVDSVS